MVTKNNKAISLLSFQRKSNWERFIHFAEDLPEKIPNDKSWKELIGDAIWDHESVNRP